METTIRAGSGWEINGAIAAKFSGFTQVRSVVTPMKRS